MFTANAMGFTLADHLLMMSSPPSGYTYAQLRVTVGMFSMKKRFRYDLQAELQGFGLRSSIPQLPESRTLLDTDHRDFKP